MIVLKRGYRPRAARLTAAVALAATFAIGAAVAALATTSFGGAAAAAALSEPPPVPYLGAGQGVDLKAVLPPPPAPGSASDRADLDLFRRTRALKDGARWRLAARDVTAPMLDVYACAIGLRLDARTAPRLSRLLAQLSDGGAVGRVKSHYQTRRPYLRVAGPICEPETAHLAGNGDYPSGHAAAGWGAALVLAELVPDRAAMLLARGRAYGESRWICGSHSRSAVEAGFLAGAANAARWHGEPRFRADMEAARAELAALRASANPPRVDAAACRQEAAASGI